MTRNVSILAAGLLSLLASSAMAAGPVDNASATEKARANFHHGVKLYNEGSFEAALAEFRRAYQISPNYRLLYNIAQTYFDLHDYVNAFKTLKQYVQEGGSEISAERRQEVGELNQKLEERIANLDIVCSQDGADIRVDDLSVGVSPLTSAVLVNAGPRRITAVKPGYAVTARTVTVVGKEKAKVIVDMAEPVETQSAGGFRSPVDGSGKEMPAAFLEGEPARKAPPRKGLITSTVVTGGCAIATGVFGILALGANSDFNSALNKIPNTKDNVDRARSKMKTYAHLADAFGAATLVSGGVMLYFLLTDPGPKKSASTKSSVALVPTVGGMALHGAW
jgi:tetratricopeptide (TPR) repeat protein